MNDIYLNAELKEKYMLDFECLLEYEKEPWKIDKGLKEKLKLINSNPNLQTLFSQNGSFDKPESFLEIAFTEDFERKFLRHIIPELLYEFNKGSDSGDYCYYRYCPPTENPLFKDEYEKFGIGCMDDPDYFKINSLTIYFSSIDLQLQDEFWNRLIELLTDVNEN